MFRFLLAVCALFLLAGCGGGPDQEAVAEANRAGAAPAADQAAAQAAAGTIHADVAETFDAGGYTYVRVVTDQGDVWAAGPVTELAVGDEVDLSTQMVMADFHSDALDRTFDRILFVSSFQGDGGGAQAAAAPQGGSTGTPPPETSVDVSGVEPVEGGKTIAELYAEGAGMHGAQVRVRGKVVKVNMNIMGTNWYHIQDGSAEGAHGDLALTSDASLSIGDMVLVEGTASVDKDFGAGYRYEIIVEDAKVTVESM